MTDIVVDNNGAIYMTGTLMHTTGGSLILMKWDTMGNLLWNQTCNSFYIGEGVAITDDESIYVITSAWVPPSINTKRKAIIGSLNIALLKWNASGTLLGVKIWDELNEDVGLGVTVGKDGNIYCVGFTGHFNGDYDFVVVVFSPVNFTSEDCLSSVSTPSLEFPLVAVTVCLLAFFVKKRKKIRD